jgi:hypothetical protein
MRKCWRICRLARLAFLRYGDKCRLSSRQCDGQDIAQRLVSFRAASTGQQADRLHGSGCLEDIDYRSARGLAKALILRLNRKHWLRDGLNLIIGGPT